MEFRLQNIGVIKDSTIRLDGLTVITGMNNSGKSTAGKALYSTIEGLNDLDHKREFEIKIIYRKILYEVNRVLGLSSISPYLDISKVNEKNQTFLIMLTRHFLSPNYVNTDNLSDFVDFVNRLNKDYIKSILKNNSRIPKSVNAYLENFEDSKGNALRALNELVSVISDNDINTFAKMSIISQFKNEFKEQIFPNYLDITEKKSRVCLKKNDELGCDFTILNNSEILNTNKIFNKLFFNDVILIDNPFILDGCPDEEDSFFIRQGQLPIPHNSKLCRFLHEEESRSLMEQKLNENQYQLVMELINKIISGEIIEKDGQLYYDNKKSKELLRVENLATGSKVFSIIKTLLRKGKINSGTMLILDEPESHLHPDWQNKFAEIIVLLVDKLNVNVLLTTHSINFALAIETYVKKYRIVSKANFYKTNYIDENNPYLVNYINTNHNLDNLYVDFVRPFSQIKAENSKYNEED